MFRGPISVLAESHNKLPGVFKENGPSPVLRISIIRELGNVPTQGLR